MIQIEKNVPIPYKKPGPQERYAQLPLKGMEIGDSFVWQVGTAAGLKVFARKIFGFEMLIKLESKPLGTMPKWRVWRIK